MSSSDLQGGDSKLKQLMREYSGQFRQKTSPAEYNNQSDYLLNEQRNNSDVRSLIQNLMKTKDMRGKSDYRITNSSRPVLIKAEEKIFQEVINLLMEINDIKNKITQEKDLITQLEIQRDSLTSKNNSKQKAGKKFADFQMDSIINKLRSKEGDEFRISMTQLENVAAENQHLQMRIKRLKLQNNGNIKQILEEEKQRYIFLKSQLEEKKSQLDYQMNSENENQNLLNQIQKVEKDIQRLKGQGTFQPNIDYEIMVLQQENQNLRDKTIGLLKQSSYSGEDEEERRRLEVYIKQEEENKLLFMEDLKQFKQVYNDLLEQNRVLKKSLANSSHMESGSRGEQKFYKYHDLVSEMQSVMK